MGGWDCTAPLIKGDIVEELKEMTPKRTYTRRSVEIDKEESDKKRKKLSLEEQRVKDRETVRGVFRFYEVPGGIMEFVIKLYKGDPVERFNLIDGQVYTLPLGVAKHLNKNGAYPVHSYAVDESGKSVMKVGQKVRRFGFQSLEFLDIEDLEEGKSLITVEYTGL